MSGQVADTRKRNCVIDLENPELREMIAEQEHEQWTDLMRYLLRKGLVKYRKPELTRIKQLMRTPYNKLTEKEKESDRKFARKVLKVFSDWWWKQP